MPIDHQLEENSGNARKAHCGSWVIKRRVSGYSTCICGPWHAKVSMSKSDLMNKTVLRTSDDYAPSCLLLFEICS